MDEDTSISESSTDIRGEAKGTRTVPVDAYGVSLHVYEISRKRFHLTSLDDPDGTVDGKAFVGYHCAGFATVGQVALIVIVSIHEVFLGSLQVQVSGSIYEVSVGQPHDDDFRIQVEHRIGNGIR